MSDPLACPMHLSAWGPYPQTAQTKQTDKYTYKPFWLKAQANSSAEVNKLVFRQFPTRAAKKTISFNEEDDEYIELYVDSLKPYNYKKHTKSSRSKGKNRKKHKTLRCFFANVTSFSNKVQEYLTHNQGRYDIFGILETHLIDEKPGFWRTLGCKCAENTAQQTSTRGSHGGEVIGYKSYLNSTKINPKVLQIIRDASPIPLRFVAVIITMHKKQFILALTYWYSGHLNLNNKELFLQLAMLKNLIGLPMITYGDYNIPHNILQDSGWLAPHRFAIHLLEGGPSTKVGSEKIEYLLIAGDIGKDILNSVQLTRVPFGPHYGYKVQIKGHGRTVGKLIKVPKPLPLDLFDLALPNFTKEQLDEKWQQAKKEAAHTLQLQKQVTGFAILGTPPHTTLVDQKLKGETFEDSKTVGEHLALAALQSEIYILTIAGTKAKDWPKHIGRSQFPKFYTNTNSHVTSTPAQYQFRLLHTTATTLNIVDKITEETVLSPKDQSTLNKYANKVQELLESQDLIYTSKPVDHFATPQDWLFILAAITGTTRNLYLLKDEVTMQLHNITAKLTKAAALDIKNSFRDHVRQDLAKNGKSMFAFVSRESKAHLSITNDAHPSYSHSPTKHLKHQNDQWAPRWHPPNPALNKALNILLLRIRKLAKQTDNQVEVEFDEQVLDKSTNTYPKNTKGIDAWTNQELKKAPTRVKQRLSTSVRYSFKKAVQPIQNMLNLHPLLGKPGGGSRTICKTPMLYRHALRGRNSVAVWESFMTAGYDTAGKGKSALLAAAYRSIKAEVYSLTEDQVIGVFHDFAKFFDTIDIEILINKAIEADFPMLDLALTIMQHVAPRIIQCDSFCGEAIIVNRSILAGCRHSVALTRVLLLFSMTELAVNNPIAQPEVYVDDTAMLAYGEREETLENITKAVLEFTQMASKLKLKLSTKGVIVAKIKKRCIHTSKHPKN